MRIVETIEGRTRLLVPKVSLERAEPPTAPVFFNPAAAMNRDISVAITRAASGKTFCDALAGVGSRGIRVANEVGRRMQVTVVDFNAPSVQLARESALLNGIGRRCEVVRSESNSFLYSRFRRDEKFDFVDIDPFGTPVQYIQAAFSAVSEGGVISLTATDTAVLCGVYPRVSLRRYGASTLNNSFHHETAIRVLLGYCRRLAASLDVGISPLAAHVTRHYVRTYLMAQVGAKKADASMDSEGYVMECTTCGHLFAGRESVSACVKCGKRTKSAGPLWTGKLVDEALIEKAASVCAEHNFTSAAKALASLGGVDAFPPYSFSLERVCSSMKVASVSPGEVAQSLGSRGFRCMYQPFEKSGLKTNGEYADVVAAVREAAS